MIRANSWRAAANAMTERRVNERPEQRNLNGNATAADPRRHPNTITVTQRVNHRSHLGRHHLVSTRRKWARHNRLALFGITTPIHNELDQSPVNGPSRINQLSRETLHRHRNAARPGPRTAHKPQCRTLPLSPSPPRCLRCLRGEDDVASRNNRSTVAEARVLGISS